MFGAVQSQGLPIFFCWRIWIPKLSFLISTKDTWIETGNCLAIPLIIFFEKFTSSTLWFFKHPEMFNPCLGWGFPKIRLLERIAKKIAKVLRGFHVHCRAKNSNVIGVENSPKMTCVWFQVKLGLPKHQILLKTWQMTSWNISGPARAKVLCSRCRGPPSSWKNKKP